MGGILKAIQGVFTFFNGLMDMARTKEDQKAGANKVKVAQYEKADDIRKDADRVRARPDRNRLQRDKGKDRD